MLEVGFPNAVVEACGKDARLADALATNTDTEDDEET